ncbi:hypothetical protein Pla163_02430 [Planctomycetes bacterium Pla163]|uniref:Inner membrane protein YjdF n=1 Tax=Rohdeia mirabilis TaxID=2528008 RepID=A0A518CV92_9BACT|nr:hypothetical protein Pla163_02430 [Planctomycetes bacterium Pla163]
MPLATRAILALRTVLVLGAILAVVQGRYLAALTTLGIVGATLLPLALGRRFRVNLPPQMELLAVVFVYASLGLGEVHGYYERFWWWDALLHTGSGMLLGIFGFLLVHVMNEHERIAMHLKPGFVALFAFMFAVGLGALWEIFEFTADSTFGLNMQKSGLVDTMWDLIVDTLGALVISLLGWRDLRRGSDRWFLRSWIREMAAEDPEVFVARTAEERLVEGDQSGAHVD